MAGLVPPELKQRFAERVSPHHGLKRARIGAVMDGQRVVQAPGRENWCYVTLTDPSDTSIAQALNLSTRWAWGVPVLVRPGPSGHLEVVGVDAAAASIEAGASAQILAVPNVAVTGIVDERRFEPGLVQAKLSSAGAYTLSVWVNSFMYPASNGALAEWPGGWLDLTSHVPGAGLRRLALIGIDPVTRTLTVIDGDTYGIATTLTTTQLALIAPAGMIPLAAVNLAYGQTEIREEHILDARIFPTAAGASAAFITLTDTPATYAGHAGHLVVVNAAESGLEFVEAAGAGPFDVDAPPATPSAYDDEFDDASLDGDWSELDPDGYQTVTEADGVLTLTNDATDTAPDVPTMLVRDCPAGDWAAATHVTTNATTNNILAGIGVVFPTAGNYVYLELVDQVSEKVLFLWLDDGGTKTFEASSALTVTDGCYLRLRYDDSETLMVGEYSLDGLSWSSVQMDISALAEAPSTFGPCIRPWGGADPVEADFEFFRVVEAFGTSTDPIYGDYGAPLALDAGQVGYTPTTGADWTDPDPTTVQAALDTLAARESGASLTVQEADGTPTVSSVATLVVTNGTLTDDGGGQVTLDFGNAATDGSAIHDNEAGEIAAITEKETPVAADMLLIEDSEDDNAKKMVQIGSLPCSGDIQLDIWDHIAANNSDPIDTALTNGAYVALLFFSSHNANSWVSASTTYTVPVGKKAVVTHVEATASLRADPAYRRARLYSVSGSAEAIAYNHFQYGGVLWEGDIAVASKAIEFAAGDEVRLELWNGDTNKRALGAYIVFREESV